MKKFYGDKTYWFLFSLKFKILNRGHLGKLSINTLGFKFLWFDLIINIDTYYVKLTQNSCYAFPALLRPSFFIFGQN